jgi:hypothetical protein
MTVLSDSIGHKTAYLANFVFDTHYKRILKDRFSITFDEFMDQLNSFKTVPTITKDQLKELYAHV